MLKIAQCSKCKEEKEIVKGKWCKECKNEYERNRRASQSDAKKEAIKQQERDRYERKKLEVTHVVQDINKLKKCTVCKMEKPETEFHIAKNKGTIRSMCKECSSKDRKNYFKENKDAIIKQTSEYKKEKLKTDPQFKIEKNLRNRLYIAFASQNKTKSERTWKYIDCSPKFLKEWIEYQLYDGMTFENYGEYWHLDHVKPCASFDLTNETEISECFNWKNIQPLRSEKNITKSSKITPMELVLQELKVKCFLRQRKKVV